VDHRIAAIGKIAVARFLIAVGCLLIAVGCLLVTFGCRLVGARESLLVIRQRSIAFRRGPIHIANSVSQGEEFPSSNSLLDLHAPNRLDLLCKIWHNLPESLEGAT